MLLKFADYFCDPLSGESLKLFSFEKENDNIITGLFVNKNTGMSYPIRNGVPAFLQCAFDEKFLSQNEREVVRVREEVPSLKTPVSAGNVSWSFSLEWDAHSKLNMTTTWGMTLESRFEHFLYETQSEKSELNGKMILDAGCGNGLLTECFSNNGLIAIGIDFSTSVYQAEKRRTSANCCFIQGDLMSPPFRPEIFDIIVSNGVLHHTPNTETTFKSVAKLVKKFGKIYIWLYSEKGTFFWRFKRKVFDYLRVVICRLPSSLKNICVRFITFLLYSIYLIGGKKLDKQTLLIDIYDSVTPRWRHYHTPEEISRWFYEAGFGPISITYWDTKYGFGAMALKTPLAKTPGEHFIVG